MRKHVAQQGVGIEIRQARLRLRVMAIVSLVVFTSLGVRLVDLALLSSAPPIVERFAMDPMENQTRRADIVDRRGRLVAIDYPKISVFADPAEVIDPDQTVQLLATALPAIRQDGLKKRLRSKSRFVWIKRHITEEEQRKIMRLGLPGVQFRTEFHRVYPQKNLMSHLIGYVGIDNQGLAGIERSFEDRLTADGLYKGRLQLTLDLGIQEVVRSELKKSVERFQAKGGTGLVLDVATGGLLASVSLPDFDPNHYKHADRLARFNRNTQGSYELGSLFKVLTAGMALDSGTVRITDGFDATKPFKMNRYSIKDFHAKKRYLTVPEIIAFSSNIGAAKMAMAFGTATQADYFRQLGLLDRHPIRLSEVSSPQRPKKWREINTVTASYGHGIAVSPVQTIDAVAAMLCGGDRQPAHFTAEERANVPKRPSVVSTETAAQLRWLTWLVVAEGTGTNAQVPGYLIGGKTGSADKVGPNGYGDKRILASFIGAFPIEDPRYLVLVTLDEPKGDAATFNYAHGGWTAAPTVANIISRSGPILGLPPTSTKAERWFRDRLVIGEAFDGRLKKMEPSYAVMTDDDWASNVLSGGFREGMTCGCGSCSIQG